MSDGDRLCCFVTVTWSSTHNRNRCGKPGIEFTEDNAGRRMWYCAEHWDAKLAHFGEAGLLRKGRLWYDKVQCH